MGDARDHDGATRRLDAPTELTPPGGELSGAEPDATAEPPLALGQEVAGKYRLLDVLGKGGFGVVYRAAQAPLGRHVALKLVHPHLARLPDFRARFFREAMAVARLNHPAIVSLYDYGEAPDGLLFMVLELVEGRPLNELIRGRGPMPPEQVVPIITQVLAGLAVAHDAGLVHRDLKPGNIMVSDQGQGQVRARVLDFGLAKLAGTEPSGASGLSGAEADAEASHPPSISAVLGDLTQYGAVVGSPSYMPPEQIKQGRLSPATDVYAIGVLLYQMLTGTKPFRGPNTKAILNAHLRGPAPEFPEGSPVPAALQRVVLAAMARAPASRPANAAQLRQQLLDAAAVSPQGRGSLVGRRHLLPALAGLVVLVCVGLTYWWTVGPGAHVEPSVRRSMGKRAAPVLPQTAVVHSVRVQPAATKGPAKNPAKDPAAPDAVAIKGAGTPTPTSAAPSKPSKPARGTPKRRRRPRKPRKTRPKPRRDIDMDEF